MFVCLFVCFYPAFKAIRKRPDDEDEEIIDIEGYGDEEDSLMPNISQDDESLELSQDTSRDTGNFESILLQDLQHSDSDSEEDDFPFGDGDEEDDELEEEEEEDSFQFTLETAEEKDSEE